MSDAEEPPNKMSKYEEYLEESEGEEYYDEGQEEWLSEELLTDDDYHTGNKNSTFSEGNQNDQNSMSSIPETAEQSLKNGIKNEKRDQNIEDTLNNLDGKNDLPSDLDAFLIRKTDKKVVQVKVEDKTIKKDHEDDDGNDTDDLLRLLEDGQQMKKKTLKMVKPQKTDDQDTTDDEFIYDRSNVKTMKLAKNALIKRVAVKAVPENMSDSDDDKTDASSNVKTMKLAKNALIKRVAVKAVPENMSDSDDDKTDASTESATMSRIFGIKDVPQKSTNTKVEKVGSQNKASAVKDPSNKDVNVSKDANRTNRMVGQVNTRQNNIEKPRRPPKQGILKTNKIKSEPKTFKSVEIIPPKKTVSKSKQIKELSEKRDMEMDEIIDEEEFLEEDGFELDEEEFEEESEAESSRKQRIMRPEMMDEEVPSDDESNSEEGSIYDELPSSDSEDFDDWFTLDIRAETASDYLPLLGGCAHSLLTAEKQRAAERVTSLRTSLSALTESTRRQADTLRNAAMALAEIDDTLRTA